MIERYPNKRINDDYFNISEIRPLTKKHEENITPSYLFAVENYTPIPYIPRRIEPVMPPPQPPPVREWFSQGWAAYLLANPEYTHSVDSGSWPIVEFFSRTLMSDMRIAMGITPSERVYAGRWYGQGYAPTCSPWSLVNACSVAGIELPSRFVAKILNLAFEDGYALESLADLTVTAGVDMKKLLLSLVGIRHEYEPMSTPVYNIRLKTNAVVIKRLIDQRHPLVLSVTSRLFYPRPNSYSLFGSHAICISGYQVTGEGYFNVQVIDSNNGIVWMSLEHLSQAVQRERTFGISRLIA
ncbi:hypothetical protein HYW46_02030 [Candidatus Daviesbacteria bacterium]|nr:hypothetical protein [Candidatus Daviesbacteria bacterium]